MRSISTQREGFTIVETLVAITVLMIAIAGPLVVASKGLFGADLARDQLFASYLAQESMETVKNVRDSDVFTFESAGWLTDLDSCTPANPCDASGLDSPSLQSCGAGACTIYKESNGYGHNSAAGTATMFTRKFFLHDPSSAGVTCPSTNDECGVLVEVDWTEAGVPYSVILTSEITSTIR